MADTAPSFPESDKEASQLERDHVHRVYEEIAGHFSSTRHTPWPRIVEFLKALPAGSLVADIGCGNGKYLGLNAELFMIGCDRSHRLVDICRERQFQAFVCDALAVPIRSGSCDACISIAVIHHLATAERRVAALQELVRLLRPGGTALVSVWAMEQEHDSKKSKYLKGSGAGLGEQRPQDGASEQATGGDKGHPTCSEPSDSGPAGMAMPPRLPVHTNRTSFRSQDLLVPWHLKGSSGKDTGLVAPGPPGPVLHRFYHVFREGELEDACRALHDASLLRSYYDQGNWCVVLQKH